MSEEEIDVAVDTDTEVEEDTNISKNSQEETVDLPEELERQRKANLDLTGRARRAEKELKELRRLKDTGSPRIKSDPQLSDELKLIARGLSDEEIDKAKVIAKGADITLQEAVKDPLFLSYQATLKENQKKENARLGASKGSGESQDDALIKPDMSRDEHIKAFKKVVG